MTVPDKGRRPAGLSQGCRDREGELSMAQGQPRWLPGAEDKNHPWRLLLSSRSRGSRGGREA